MMAKKAKANYSVAVWSVSKGVLFKPSFNTLCCAEKYAEAMSASGKYTCYIIDLKSGFDVAVYRFGKNTRATIGG